MKIRPPVEFLRALAQREVDALAHDLATTKKSLADYENRLDGQVESKELHDALIASVDVYNEVVAEARTALHYATHGCKSEIQSLVAEAELLDAGALRIADDRSLVVVALGEEAESLRRMFEIEDNAEREIEGFVEAGNAEAVTQTRGTSATLTALSERDLLQRMRNRSARLVNLIDQRAPNVIIENERELIRVVASEYVRRWLSGDL